MKTFAIPGKSDLHIGRQPEGALEVLTPRPSPKHVFAPDGTWVKGFELEKSELAEAFEIKCYTGYEYYGERYRCKQVDMQAMELRLSQAKRFGETELDIRAADYTWHKLTVGRFEALCQHVANTYYDAWKEYSLALNELYAKYS